MATLLGRVGRAAGRALLGLLLLFFATAAAGAAGGPVAQPIQLFGTMEFRGTLRALPKWTGIIDEASAQIAKLTVCRDPQAACAAAALSWQQMLEKAQSLSPREQLNWVNTFFNRWPYRLDMETYGRSDYWATPEEFMRYSGDCEDYSISKYFALRQLGYPPERLRIVVLRDKIRNIGHAVLVAYQNGDAYVLDNLSNLVLSHNRYLHYVPYYSINETHRWAHGELPDAARDLTNPRKGQ